MKKEVEIIEICWEGPFKQKDIVKLNNSWDFGVYQIYGTHRIFGTDSLLYIGKAESRTFAQRIAEHEEWTEWESKPVDIYVGRLGGSISIENKKWDQMISWAESLLIFYSAPPYNTKNLNGYGEIKSVVVLNYKCRNKLPTVVTSLEDESQIGESGGSWKEFGRKK